MAGKVTLGRPDKQLCKQPMDHWLEICGHMHQFPSLYLSIELSIALFMTTYIFFSKVTFRTWKQDDGKTETNKKTERQTKWDTLSFLPCPGGVQHLVCGTQKPAPAQH